MYVLYLQSVTYGKQVLLVFVFLIVYVVYKVVFFLFLYQELDSLEFRYLCFQNRKQCKWFFKRISFSFMYGGVWWGDQELKQWMFWVFSNGIWGKWDVVFEYFVGYMMVVFVWYLFNDLLYLDWGQG